VQHEFFIGSTPVLAFKTGGLKDTVIEFDARIDKGNGVNFQDHKAADYIYAVDRAMALFQNKKKYEILRKNAFESTIDGAEVCRAWDKEFKRLFNKTFIDPKMLKDHLDLIDKSWDETTYEEKLSIRRTVVESPESPQGLKKVHHHHHFLKAGGNTQNHTFTYKTSKLPRPKSIMVIGTFNNWKSSYPMNYDHIMDKWNLTLAVAPGEYFYKFIVDDLWVCSDEDPKLNDIEGNLNNYLRMG